MKLAWFMMYGCVMISMSLCIASKLKLSVIACFNVIDFELLVGNPEN